MSASSDPYPYSDKSPARLRCEERKYCQRHVRYALPTAIASGCSLWFAPDWWRIPLPDGFRPYVARFALANGSVWASRWYVPHRSDADRVAAQRFARLLGRMGRSKAQLIEELEHRGWRRIGAEPVQLRRVAIATVAHHVQR